MKLSREARRFARGLYHIALKNGRVDPTRVRQIADELIERKPRHYLSILKEFTRLVRLALEKRHAVVDSSYLLEEGLRSDIQSSLKRRFGEDLSFDFRVRPENIGGLRVKLGSDIWDGSVRGRLEALKRAALNGQH